MKKVKAISCDKCESIIVSGNTNGLPNGVGFELDDGKVITLCANCLKDLCSRDDKGKDAFFKEIGIERG